MSDCNDGSGRCKSGKCGQRRNPLPRAGFSLQPIWLEAMRGLMTVVRTGVIPNTVALDLPTTQLAREIQTLWKLARGITPVVNERPKVADDPTWVSVPFGPNNQYTLNIPVTGPIAKKELADSLRAIAQTLDPGGDEANA